VLAALASIAAVPEPIILLVAAAVGLAAAAGPARRHGTAVLLVGPMMTSALPSPARVDVTPFGGAAATAAALGAAALPSTVLPLFVSFLKLGAVLFGSGYLLVALLRDEFVLGLGWLSERQLLDAVAVGQFTPGPVFTTATFVGYLILGLPGAVAGTLGMAVPAVAFVALSIPVLDRLRESRAARLALEAVSAAVVGLLVVVALALGRSAVVDAVSLVVGLIAFVVLVRATIGPAWLIVAGAALGAFRTLLVAG
jgi:chromate transporter